MKFRRIIRLEYKWEANSGRITGKLAWNQEQISEPE